MSYKLAIFDLDGTLLDTLDDLTDSVNHGLEALGLSTRTTGEIRSFIGNGSKMLISRAVPEGTDEATTNAVFDTYSEYYKTHGDIKTKPYDGIMDMLHELKKRGVRLALLSNKPDFAVQILDKRYFDGIFDFAAGERAGIPRKPAPDAIFKLLEDLGFESAEAVYIGDSDVDIEVADNAGMNCISVCWGFQDRAHLEKCGAKCIVSSAAELLAEIIK